MNVEKYISMSANELYTVLISDVMDNPSEGRKLVEKLSELERFKQNYDFRASVETARSILLAIGGDTKEAISLASALIQTADAFKMWQLVSTNWNILGIAYSQIGLYERSLECYHQVIKNEKEHGLVSMTSLAYNNIAILYLNFEDVDKSWEYFSLAVDALMKGGEDQPRYKSKMILYLSNLIAAYANKNDLSNIESLLKKIDQKELERVSPNIKSAYHYALMLYHFRCQKFEQARDHYLKAKAFTDSNNSIAIFALLSNYLDLCKKANLDFDFYLDELLTAERMESSSRALANIKVYLSLREYYKHIGNTEKYYEMTQKYIEFLEKDAELTNLRQCQSFQIVEDLIYKNENMNAMISKKTELELVAEEAVRTKNSLQRAYQQIELITELGKKITSSINLNEVVDLIYQNINNNLPISIFILAVYIPEDHTLKTVAYYKDGEKLPEFTLNVDTSKGFLAKCYKTRNIISTTDKKYHNFFKKQKKMQTDTDINSAIFLPLIVDDRVIGICSVQDKETGVYHQVHISFLEELLPYLSISLNNALSSRRLEKEIQSHLITQEELTKANKRLERISSLDGLTQISSRRDFDSRITDLILQADEKSLPLSIFMMDIDKFKLYNDNYGHLEGDEVLKKVAYVFRENLDHHKGLSARFGGEEFIGACIGLNLGEVYALAEKIRSDIFLLNIPHKGSTLQRLSVSIGVAITYQVQMQEKSNLMKQADICLYEAKEDGRNKVVMKEYVSLLP